MTKKTKLGAIVLFALCCASPVQAFDWFDSWFEVSILGPGGGGDPGVEPMGPGGGGSHPPGPDPMGVGGGGGDPPGPGDKN